MNNTTTNNKENLINATKGYSIDFISGTIFITRAFAKKAGTVGTDEFKYFIELRNAYPEYAIKYKEIEKKANKQSYSGLSIYKMKAFLMTKKDAAALEEFEAFCKTYEKERGKYATIKRAFLNKHKEEYTSLNTDDIVAINRLATELKNAVDTKQTKSNTTTPIKMVG